MDQFGFSRHCLQNLLFFFSLKTNSGYAVFSCLRKNQARSQPCVQASHNKRQHMASCSAVTGNTAMRVSQHGAPGFPEPSLGDGGEQEVHPSSQTSPTPVPWGPVKLG